MDRYDIQFAGYVCWYAKQEVIRHHCEENEVDQGSYRCYRSSLHRMYDEFSDQ